MSEQKRLARIRAFLDEKGWTYEYNEEDGCGSLDFDYRGVPYHIWEFIDGEAGVESNVRSGGKQEDFFGDYEEEVIEVIRSWQ